MQLPELQDTELYYFDGTELFKIFRNSKRYYKVQIKEQPELLKHFIEVRPTKYPLFKQFSSTISTEKAYTEYPEYFL